MKRALVVALAALALAGCVGPRGGHYVGGDLSVEMFGQSFSDADYVCRQELPFDAVWPAASPMAHGLSVGEQRNRYYQKCMAIMGQPNASLAPAAPNPSPTDPAAAK